MFSNVYRLDLHNIACVALAKSTTSINKNHSENWDYFLFGYRLWKCMFVDSLTDCVGPPDFVFTVERGVVSETWWRSPIFLKHVTLWFSFLWSLLDHRPIKCRCPIKESDQVTPAYLMWNWIWWHHIAKLHLPLTLGGRMIPPRTVRMIPTCCGSRKTTVSVLVPQQESPWKGRNNN
jgi:hypothetical protein